MRAPKAAKRARESTKGHTGARDTQNRRHLASKRHLKHFRTRNVLSATVAGFLRQFGRHVESLPSCAYVCDVCCLYTSAIGTAAAQQLGHSRLTMLILLSPISRIRCFSSSSNVRRSSARLRPDRAGPALASSRLVDSDECARALCKQSRWERI